MEQIAFWRREPLNEQEGHLLQACVVAHASSATRDNISAVALRLAAAGSGDYARALAAALVSIGGPHAPIVQAYDLIAEPEPEVTAASMLDAGRRVPGWGSSFAKGKPDPIWTPVDAALRVVSPYIGVKLDKVTEVMKAKNVYPNPSVYTAATAMALRMRKELSPWIFIAGRLNAWTTILVKEGQLWQLAR